MRNLYNPETFQSEVDDLYNGTLIPRKVVPVTVEGEGIIKRGTPLTSEDGITFVKFIPGEGPIFGILLFDVDADDEDEASGAVLGISGEFNKNKIEEVIDDELDPADIMVAWGRNIHIEANNTYPATPDFPLG
jgi:hypothetical protein